METEFGGGRWWGVRTIAPHTKPPCLHTAHPPAILSGPRMSAATAIHTAISGAPRPNRPMVVVEDEGRPLSHPDDRASAGEPKDVRENALCLRCAQGRKWAQ